ncbi:uncharacterized protein THITE_2107339 [Thermothielavioides terrestris NRRL 8126]|uniref:Uncharacterized protein n=1 Tax=Thermothielavioides terrestris (strain ATCC 38088 / NRRL 8126) TaxID=578455 RepID=G2QTR0_THETT|nr:uncharacterized protein THITE_2107339 [Thermothielavioides terrestris NRRL 8126]AEO62770.1 hypothetical protein THITE_2107339 [Thermothielavioides terrestris NRRL 8126]
MVEEAVDEQGLDGPRKYCHPRFHVDPAGSLRHSKSTSPHGRTIQGLGATSRDQRLGFPWLTGRVVIRFGPTKRRARTKELLVPVCSGFPPLPPVPTGLREGGSRRSSCREKLSSYNQQLCPGEHKPLYVLREPASAISSRSRRRGKEAVEESWSDSRSSTVLLVDEDKPNMSNCINTL